MALPSNVNYGTVVGQFLLAYADGSDVGPNPDGVPAKGSIYFRPSPIKLLDPSASPNPVTILPAVVECVLDNEGYLLGSDGTRGVRLVATDDADLNPTNWTWLVEFRLTAQDDTPVSVPSFSISLPSSTTVDLTTVSPVPSANGTYYLVGPTGPAGPANTLSVGSVTTGAAGSSAAVTITGTSPSQTINFTIPRGDTGATGATGATGPTGPQGDAATIAVGTVTTGAPGSSATVTNAGTSSAAVFNFSIPRGDTGAQGPQGIQGETGPIGPTGATGINWQGTWSNTTDYVNNDAVYYNNSSWFASGNPPVGEVPSLSSTFWFPLALQGATGATGPQGAQGVQGDAATIAVGTVTTGSPSTPASVTNVGTSGAAIFNFTIPKGDTGDIGSISATAPVTYNSGTSTIGFNWAGTVLDDLGNVSVASPNNGDMVKYNSATSTWEKSNIIDGGNA